jgi:hypothetical protein
MNASRGRRRGGFAPSAQGAAGRGLVLIGIAVLIGLLLLWQGLDDGDEVSAGDGGAVTDGGGSDGGPGTTEPGGTDGTDAGTDGTDAGTDGTDAGTDGTDAGTDGGAVPPAATRPPEQVAVLVANGSGTRGAAGTVSDKLKAVNFNTLDPANATATPNSRVYYRPGYDEDAKAVAGTIGATPDLVQPVPDPVGVDASAAPRTEQANVIVIIGSDGRIPVQ